MSDACKHRSGRKTPPSYSFPSLGSRARASRHALVLPGPGPTKGTEDGSCFTREGELHGARPHRAGAPTLAIGVCKSDPGARPPETPKRPEYSRLGKECGMAGRSWRGTVHQQ